MDPTAALRDAEAGLDAFIARNDIHQSLLDLREWLSHGGFAPHWAMYPRATREFVALFGWRPSMPESFLPGAQ